MNKSLFERMLSELKLQTNFAIISINLMNEQFDKMSDNSASGVDISASYTFWYALQNYVVSLGNISKLLYGVKGTSSDEVWNLRKKQRNFFRNRLNIKNNTTLKNRQMRNLLEHIDENIERFVLSDPEIVVDRMIGPQNNSIMIENKNFYNNDFYNLRSFLTDINEFWLFNSKFSITETFSEILDLRDTIITTEKTLREGGYDALFD